MSKQRVTDTEIAALLRDLRGCDTSIAEGYTFHRIQEGYADDMPRAVFVHPDEEPVGSPLGKYPAPLLSLIVRLAADLQDARGREHERALSPTALAMLRAGIESAKAEPVVYLGDFASDDLGGDS